LEQDPAGQLDALAAAGVDQVFLDHASGALTERPQLIKLLAQIRPGDTLVVWRLDRLGRSTAHLIETVTELGERGIGFQSLTEAIDTSTSAGRLLVGILASPAAFERDLIRERTMAGLAAAGGRDKLGGRPSLMTRDKLEVARRMLAEGRPKSVIAKTIDVSQPTLYQHLRRDLAKQAR
jgi:DNA invertase Pin-like site-specific DNA recombinase